MVSLGAVIAPTGQPSTDGSLSNGSVTTVITPRSTEELFSRPCPGNLCHLPPGGVRVPPGLRDYAGWYFRVHVHVRLLRRESSARGWATGFGGGGGGGGGSETMRDGGGG